jgi:hypothetical protein
VNCDLRQYFGPCLADDETVPMLLTVPRDTSHQGLVERAIIEVIFHMLRARTRAVHAHVNWGKEGTREQTF